MKILWKSTMMFFFNIRTSFEEWEQKLQKLFLPVGRGTTTHRGANPF